jgi:hypothetical protein
MGFSLQATSPFGSPIHIRIPADGSEDSEDSKWGEEDIEPSAVFNDMQYCHEVKPTVASCVKPSTVTGVHSEKDVLYLPPSS